MADSTFFLEDVEAIQKTILDAFNGVEVDGAKLVNDVGHHMVESETPAPYVLVFDVVSVPQYAFRSKVVANDGLYIIRCVTQDTDEKSAQTIAGLIHARIYDALQGKQISVAGYDKPFRFRRGPREPTNWEVPDSNTRYFHSGYKWVATDT